MGSRKPTGVGLELEAGTLVDITGDEIVALGAGADCIVGDSDCRLKNWVGEKLEGAMFRNDRDVKSTKAGLTEGVRAMGEITSDAIGPSAVTIGSEVSADSTGGGNARAGPTNVDAG